MKISVFLFVFAVCISTNFSNASAAVIDFHNPDDNLSIEELTKENLELKETINRLKNKIEILETLLQNSRQEAPTNNSSPRAKIKLGLEGYDPVVLFENQRWKSGDVKFGVVHRGQTYLFSSAENQKKFLAAPDRYAPVLDGSDPIEFLQGKVAEGFRKHGVFYNEHVYLFANEVNLDKFSTHPLKFDELNSQAEKIAKNAEKTAPSQATAQVAQKLDHQETVAGSQFRPRRHLRR